MVKVILLWGVILLCEAIFVILMVPPTLIVDAADKEQRLVTMTLGSSVSEEITSRAKSTFDSWFMDTGIVDESFHLFVPSEEAKRKSQGIETMGETVFEIVRRRLESFWNMVFVGIQRAHGFLVWFPILLPFFIASTFDGFTVRRVKLLTFGMSSAPVYGAAMHTLIVLAFFPLYYALCPFAVTPLIVPVWFIALALTIKALVGNLQRM